MQPQAPRTDPKRLILPRFSPPSDFPALSLVYSFRYILSIPRAPVTSLAPDPVLGEVPASPLRSWAPASLPHPQSSARPLHYLGPQFSQGLDTSSLNEARPGSPLLYICQRPQTSSHMLLGWWLSV